MLTLQAASPDLLWDTLLPSGVRILPDHLQRLDQLLDDPQLLAPFRQHWERLETELERAISRRGRPTIAMATYLRVMLVKYRQGWGYETLMREISDSIHLRRFCLIALSDQVPDESTVRKLTRRLGPQVVEELGRRLLKLASENGFQARAMRCDSTVVEGDIRFPTDSGLSVDAVRVLARAARRVRAAIPDLKQKVRDRTGRVGKLVRALSRSLRRRSGEAKDEVEKMTKAAAEKVTESVQEARRLLEQAKASTLRQAGYSERARAKAIAELEWLVELSTRVVEQVRQRFAGEKISDRLLSFFDTDARVIRRGKLAQPNQFGYVAQITEVTSTTGKGARGLLLPFKVRAGSTHDNELLPDTVKELEQLQWRPRQAAFDGGFVFERTNQEMAKTGSEVFIVGSPSNTATGSGYRRLARYRVGCEGRISHLKREYGARRSRLKGLKGVEIVSGWTAFAYNINTMVITGLTESK